MSDLTYKNSGVDIDEGDRLVDLIKPAARRTFRKEVMADLGSFGSLFKLDLTKYPEPVLVSGTDGVGTKLKVAFMAGKHDTVGIDLVAMCVNDILTCGAEPLFFLDYFATGKLKADDAAKVIAGIAEGCSQAGAALVGGETAEMPGFYDADEYDLAGFAVGVVNKSAIIDGSRIAPGDVLVGIASSGLHSNGYSLARKAFFDRAGMKPDSHVPELGGALGDALLTPTRIYVKAILDLMKQVDIKGMAHITGGGIPGNVPRCFPKGVHAVVNEKAWPVPPVFTMIQKIGNVPQDDMRQTFNMGIGYVIVIAAKDMQKVLDFLKRNGYDGYVIGQVAAGDGDVRYEG